MAGIMEGRCTICGTQAPVLLWGTKCEACAKKFGRYGHPGPIKDRAADNFTSAKEATNKKDYLQKRHLAGMGINNVVIDIKDIQKAVETKSEPKVVKKVTPKKE